MTRRLFVLAAAGSWFRSSRAWLRQPHPGRSACPPRTRITSSTAAGRSCLISSAEHYGAVINQDFDFVPYLAELERDGHEPDTALDRLLRRGSEGVQHHEQHARAGDGTVHRALGARAMSPGYANGGNKFDLSRWDDAFFTRLEGFLAEAARRGVMVEVVLFCPFYQDSMWELSPLNPRNNVNGLGAGLHAAVRVRPRPARPGGRVLHGHVRPQDRDRGQPLRQSLLRARQRALLLRYIVPDRFQRHVADLIVAIEKRAAEAAPHRAEHLERHQEDRQPASGGVDLQLPLRLAAGRRRRSTTRWAKSSATMRRDFGDSRTCRTGSRRGTSSLQAAASSRTSTTPTRPRIRPAPGCRCRRISQEEADRSSAGRCGFSPTS